MFARGVAKSPAKAAANSTGSRTLPQRQGQQAASFVHNIGNQAALQLLAQQTASATPATVNRGLATPGSPMEPAIQDDFGRRFGHEFSQVRVHTGPAAAQSARDLNARAYTVGADIVFAEGRFSPQTAAGRRLIAHELAHVVQQDSGRARGGASGPAHEAAADGAAQVAVNGGQAHAGPAAAVGVQCEPLSAEEIAKLNEEQLRVRLQANEKEAEFMMNSDEYNEQLSLEHRELQQQLAAGVKLPRSVAPAAAAPDPAVVKALESVNAELAEVTPLVNQIAAGVLADPADYALNAVRNLDGRLRADEKAVREFEPVAGGRAGDVHAAVVRFQAMQTQLAPAVARAIAWHSANPAGESVGMANEEAGTALAGAGLDQWDKASEPGVLPKLHYVPGALAFVGAFGVALVDADEKLVTFGYHDASTAVAQAYARGDISWNEGKSILRSAAWRALLVAAVTRGAGMATSRLGVLGAEAAGLESTTLRYGLVAGGIQGGLTTATSLGAQALLTKQLEDRFKSPEAKAIWDQGLPQGKDWAIAIPLGVLTGALGGARGVEIANDKLVGSIVQTPSGPMKIAAITKLQVTTTGGRVGLTQPGVMVLEPVGGNLATIPPPPLADFPMIYDPLTDSWSYANAPSTGLATSPLPRPAAPAGGGAIAPVRPTGVAPAAVVRAPTRPVTPPAAPKALPPGRQPAGLLPARSAPLESANAQRYALGPSPTYFTDPFTSQRSAIVSSRSSPGAGNIHEGAGIAELEDYKAQLNLNGKVGIQAPGLVNAGGPDSVVYDIARDRIEIRDTKLRRPGGQFPKAPTRADVLAKWGGEVDTAVNGQQGDPNGGVRTGNPDLDQRIRRAWAAGRWDYVQVNVRGAAPFPPGPNLDFGDLNGP